MSDTVRHGMPLLSAGQAQKEVTHNEAVLTVDRLLHLAVMTRALSAPPSSPVAGDAYIVAAGGSGEWAGFSGQLASHDGFGWVFSPPVRGCLAWIVDEASFSVFDGGWSTGGWPASALFIAGRSVLGAPPVAVLPPAGGATVDTQCRAALGQLITTLRNQGILV